jgi:hypothetical protein
MAAINSPLRIRAVPEMPSEEAMPCSSGSNIEARPLPGRRRRVEPDASSDAWTLETSDVTSVVSLNGFLP